MTLTEDEEETSHLHITYTQQRKLHGVERKHP